MRYEEKSHIAAIEFGTSKIVTIIAAQSNSDRMEIIGSGTVPYDGYSGGDWNTPRQMVRRLRDSITAAEMEAGSKIKEVYIGVPGEYIRVLTQEAEVDLPEGYADDEALDRVHDAAADALKLYESDYLVLHRSPAWYKVGDSKASMDAKGNGDTLRACITFVVADPNFVEDMKVMMGVLDITILGFLSTTMGEGFLMPTWKERDDGAVIVDFGYLNTEVSLFRGDAMVYHAMLPRGGGHITADLVEALHIDMRAAERIKREYSLLPDQYDKDSYSEVQDADGNRTSFPREVIREVVEKSANEILDMVDMTIKNDIEPLLSQRSSVFITGGGLMMAGEREYVSEKLGRPVKKATVKSTRLNSPVFSAATGLMNLTFLSIEATKPEEAETNVFRSLFKSKKD